MSMKGKIVSRRTDRASLSESALMDELHDLRRPIAGDVPLAQVVNPMVRQGELYNELPDKVVHCFACAHGLQDQAGRARYLPGALQPWRPVVCAMGLCGALQCDPTEKKPFNHIYPGSDTLTFGMLGCDLHCPYCQNWDISQAMRDATPVVRQPG